MQEAAQIGVYGGSFDPIHVGHLAVAEEVRVSLDLQRLLIVPAARQPLKAAAAQGASPPHRLSMARLACANNPAFLVDDLELERPPPSYTVDTLRTLQARYGPATQLWFVLGADAARDLPRWQRADEIVAIARLAIVGRPGANLHLPSLEQALPGLAGRYRLLDGPRLDVSSSELRRRRAAGRPIRYQVPEAVWAYIEAEGLYADDAYSSTAAR